MATATTRPMAVTITDFNDRLDEQIKVNFNGQIQNMSYWSALHYAPKAAEKCLAELQQRIEHYQVAADKSALAAEVQNFVQQRDALFSLVAAIRSIAQDFRDMQLNFDRDSRSKDARPIMTEADIEPVILKITNLANALELNFLTERRREGTGYPYPLNNLPTIPGRIERLKGLLPQKKV